MLYSSVWGSYTLQILRFGLVDFFLNDGYFYSYLNTKIQATLSVKPKASPNWLYQVPCTTGNAGRIIWKSYGSFSQALFSGLPFKFVILFEVATGNNQHRKRYPLISHPWCCY